MYDLKKKNSKTQHTRVTRYMRFLKIINLNEYLLAAIWYELCIVVDN